MNLGDRVRMLHGSEEGIIRKISGSRVEIEIEEGFLIPALKSEVVVISEAERQHFKGEKTEQIQEISPQKTSNEAPGLHLAFLPINDQQLSLYFVNSSKRDFLTRINATHGDNAQTLLAQSVQSGSAQKFDDRLIKDLQTWPVFLIQCLPIHPKLEREETGFEKKLRVKAAQFFKNKVQIPVLNREGYLFTLTRENQDLDIRTLNEELAELKDSHEELSIQRPPSSVDLHIEELVSDPKGMSNSEMLKVQLTVFEKNLDQAIASGMDQISFIHGIGNGVLRKEIHKRLSQMKNINYFQDTQKDRWGYGATLVRIS
ncbi:Smr/MutS family protein [Algoriphagus namhaensis]